MGQYIRNINGALVPNTAPVSNNLPIVSVFTNEVNTFRVTAQDPEGSNLTYSLGTPLDMGGTTLTLAPNLNVSTSGVVTFDTRGINAGYWCTQIKFSDGLCYAVVDFLIYSAPRPKICSAICGNKAASCTADANCTSCTGGNTGQCIVASSPSLVSPTPTDGTSYTLAVGVPVIFQWSGYTPNLNANMTVTSSSLPSGTSLVTTTTPGAFMNQTLSWTPSLAQVGVYVITLGCYDSGGQTCPGQVSFSISVPRPYCGYGTITPANCDPASKTCTCTCQAGFDPSQYCYDCLPGYYGSSCTQCPPCVNGACVTGYTGTGGCNCFSGWQGVYCNLTLNTPCNLTVNNYVGSTISIGTYVNPSTTTAVINTNATKPALTIPFTTMTNTPTKLDILVLCDVTKSITTAMFAYLLSPYSKTFFAGVRALTTNSYFGVASFTDQPLGTGCSTSDYPFRLHSPLSGDQTDFESAITSYFKTTTLGCDDTVSKNDAQLDALYGATSSSVGWRTDAFRVVILITDSPFWEGAGYATGSIYANRTDVYNALIANNIVPLILPTSAASSYYTALISSINNIGLASVIASDYSNVYTTAVTQLALLFKAFSTIVVQDNYGFVTSYTAKQTLITAPQTVSSSIAIQFPQAYINASLSTYPTITVTMLGWGSASVIAQINRKPIPSVVTRTTREDVNADIPVAGYDPDGNAMFVILDTLPTLGTLYVNKSLVTAVVKGTTYNLPDGLANPTFTYVPRLHVYGSDYFQYYLSDGCAKSASLNASITVTYYDYPPVANSISTNATENVSQNFTLSGSDVETPTNQLAYVILSLPDPNLGLLKHVATKANVVLNDVFAQGESTILFVPVTYACCDNAQFTYQVKDNSSQLSNIATYSIFINPVNQVPVASASNIQVDRGVQTAIVLSVFDPDRNDKETFTVTSYTAGAGSSFNLSSGVAFGAAPVFLGNYTVSSTGAASTTIYFTSSSVAQGSNFANATFTVTDSSRAVSTPVTVVVSINPINHAPTANPCGPIPLFQDSISGYYNLNGTDVDPADANSLQVQIVVLPSKGTMVQRGGSNITTVPFTLTNPYIAYRSSSTGDDTFSFRVVDNLGSLSALQVVHFTIIPVNHPPTLLLSTISTNEDASVIGQASTYDQDGDTVTVYIASLPRGTLTQFDGTPITTVPTALTDSQYRFKFLNLQYESGSPYTTFTLYADDNAGKANSRSATITTTINVITINYPPVPTAFSFSLNENDPPVQFTLPGTDVDTSANQLTGFLTSLPSSTMGVIQDLSGNPIAVRQVIPAPRTIQFVANQYQKGTVSFSFGLNDGTTDSNSVATATITVNHVNHAPWASVSTPVIVTRTVAKSITLTLSDYDIGDQQTVTITSIGGGGTLTYGSTTITSAPYTIPGTLTIPNSNSITLALNYVAPAIANGAGYGFFTFLSTDNGTPALSTASTNVSISIAQNNIPQANPAGPLSVTQDSTSQPLILSGTDADVADANSLVVVIMSLPAKGTLRQAGGTAITTVGTTVPSGSVIYNTNQRAGDQFSFAVRDNLGALSASQTVTTTVTPVNHPPTAFFVGTASAVEDNTLLITNIQASDPDAGDTVTIVINQAPTGGVMWQYDNTPCNSYPCTVTDLQYRVQYVPNLRASGNPITTLNFSAFDGQAYSPPVYGALTITFVDYPPTANSTTSQLSENDPAATITLNYVDIDSAPSVMTAQILSLPSAGLGTLTTTSGTTINVGDVIFSPLNVVFTPAMYSPGNTSFSFKVKDAATYSNVATLSISIRHINHAPTALWVGTASTNEDSTLFVTQIQATDPDVGDTLTVTVNTGPSVGSLQQANGAPITTFPAQLTDPQYNLKYVPPLHGWGNPLANISFYVSDGQLVSATITGVFVINFVNYPPVSSPSSVTIQENAAPTNISLGYTDFDSPATAMSTTILSIPPASIGKLTTPSGTAINAGDTISGTFVIFNTVQYSPGASSFTFKIKDELSYSSSSTISVTIQHVNHPPTAGWVGTASANEDQNVTITNIRATDPDTASSNDIVSVKVTVGPSAGTLYQYDGQTICTAPCTISDPQFRMKFQPALHGWGNSYASITFVASDGTLNSQAITGNISITFVDYPPVASSSSTSCSEDDASVTITFSYTDFDSNPSVISTTIVSLPSSTYGRLTTLSGTALNVGDSFSGFSVLFIPIQYSPGSTSFSFKLKDATSYSNTATVSVTVNHVNHPPTALWAGQAVADEDTPLYITNIQVSDPDRVDTPKAAIMAAPSAGTLSQYDGSVISSYPVVATDPQGRFKFSTIPNANGLPYTTVQAAAWDGTVYSTYVPGQLFINPVNDPPVATASTVSVTESTPTAITLTVTDIDTDVSNLTAVVQSLPSSSTGSLMDLNGNALTVGSIITPNAQNGFALQVMFTPVQYVNDGTSFSFSGFDGQLASSTVTVTISITPVYQTPVCGISPSNSIVVPFPSQTTVQLTVFDPDPHESYTFRITGLVRQHGGVLDDGSNNVLSSSSTVAPTGVQTTNYYAEVPIIYAVDNSESSATMNVTFVVNDGRSDSSPCSINFASTVNHAPVASPISSTVNAVEEHHSPTMTLTGTDQDAGSTLTTLIAILPQYGTLYRTSDNAAITSAQTFLPAGQTDVYYVSNNLYRGPDSYKFTVQDPPGSFAPLSTVSILVTPFNHPPTIVTGGDVTTLEDTPLTITGVFPFDPDGDTVVVMISAAPSNGAFQQTSGAPINSYPAQVTDSNNNFVFIPPQDANSPSGPYTNFSVYAQDASAATSTTALAYIYVTPVDDPPVSGNVVVNANENDAPSTITLTYTDVDTAASGISMTILSLPDPTICSLSTPNGAVSLGDTLASPFQLTMTQFLYGHGNTSFSFNAKDRTSYAANVGVVSITVTHINHPPTAVWAGTATADENGILDITEIQVTDHDLGDTFTVQVTQVPALGILYQFDGTTVCNTGCNVVDSQFRMKFVPAQYGNGVDPNPYATIQFQATDNGGLSSNSATGSLNINFVDQPPVASPTPVSIQENAGPTTLSLQYTDADSAPSAMKTIIVSLPSSTYGTLTTIGGAAVSVGDIISSTSFMFTPAQYAPGTTSFSFKVEDATTSSNTETATITIQHVNHNPTAVWSGNAVADENTVLTITQIQASDHDAGDIVTVTVTQGPTPTQGALTQYDGTPCAVPCAVTDSLYRMVFTPTTFAYGTPLVTLQFQADDNHNGTSGTISGTLNINFVDQAPVALASTVSMNENDPVANFAFGFSDVDNTPQQISAVVISLPPTSLGTVFNSTGGAVSVGDIISYPQTATFAPALYGYGSGTLSFGVQDSYGVSSASSAAVSFSVTHVNHPPTLTWAGTASADEDTTLVITNIQVTDPDVGDILSVNVTQGPSVGTLQQFDGTPCASYPCLVTDGQFRLLFIPVANANGQNYASIQVQASDGHTTSSLVTGSLNIIPVDDPPVANSTTVDLLENQNSTFTFSYSDIDSSPSTIYATVLSLPPVSLGILYDTSSGTAVPVAIGDNVPSLTLLFVTAAYSYGNANFSFQVHDATSYSNNVAQVTLSVTHVNHSPSASSVSVVAVRGQPLSITLSGSDPDNGDTFAFPLDGISINGGTFTAGGSTLTLSTVNIATTVQNTALHTFSTTVTYTAPITASGTNFSSLAFHIVDQSGLTSTTQEVSIDITPNSIPIATAGAISAVQDGVSPSVVITGTDADPADTNTLLCFITTLPAKGILIIDSSHNVTAVPYQVAQATSVTYYTNLRGGDSFSFYVQDNVGAVSSNVTIPITITPTNHAPTAAFHGPVVTLENQNASVSAISTSDPDGDTVTVYITSLPAFGGLYQNDGTPIITVPTAITNTQSLFSYVPPTDQFGATTFTFYADDGQGASNSQTPSITATIGVSHVDGAPVAVNGTTVADENTLNLNITLDVIDADTPDYNLSIYITNLPDSSIGALYDANGYPIQPYMITSKVVFFVLVPFASGNTSFSFIGFDGSLDSGNTATQIVSITHINQIPSITSATSFNLERSVPATISVYAYDGDTPEYFDFIVLSCSAPQGGNFYYNGVNLKTYGSNYPLFLDTHVAKISSGNKFNINFTAPDNQYGNNFAQIALAVRDSYGTYSPTSTITLNVLAGSKPVANSAGPITFAEESSSSTITLGGTDTDSADSGKLSAVITALPSKAVLVQKGANGGPDQNITAVGTTLTNPVVYLVGDILEYGSDSFYFEVVDMINSTSTTSKISVTITHINHPPTAGVVINPGQMNQPLHFNVFGQDPDNDLPLYIYITAVPTTGYLLQGDGTPISAASPSSPVLVTDFLGALTYVAPTNTYGTPIGSISIYVNDGSGASNSNSPVFTQNITMYRVNLPPFAANVTTSMPQNSQLVLQLNVTDPQGYPTVVTILTFPPHGTVYRSDGVTVIDANNPTTGSDAIVIYAPPPKEYDSGDGTPYASFTYWATSNSSLTSNTGYVSVSVNQTIGAPVFTGLTSYSIADNTNLTMLLSATSETGSYSIVITSALVNSSKGVLYVRLACMGDEACPVQYVDNTNIPYLMSDPGMENRLRYTPPPDQYGDAFAVFTLIVIDPGQNGQSAPVNITINIYHVNVPPVILPYIYYSDGGVYNWSNAIININEGEDATIVWRLTDKDTPQANLTSFLYALPYRGHLYTCVSDGAGSCTAGTLIASPGFVVNNSADFLFRVVYRPVPASSGTNYATFSITGFDGIDKSDRISLKINVKHNNLPPVIQVATPSWNASTSNPIIVTGVSVNDSDASFYSESFRLTLTDINDKPPSSGILSLIGGDPSSNCDQESNFTINCTAPLSKLNYLLQQISIQVNAQGYYVLTVYADDLGAGADVTDRATSHLNDTAYIQINVTNNLQSTDLGKPNSSSVMTAVVASAAGAGVAAAFGAWRYMKKKIPPTEVFFGHDGIDSSVTDNPLYEESAFLSFSNALYEGK